MTSDMRFVWDATGANIGGLTIPPGIGTAGYMTGSAGVPWTMNQWIAHPGAVRIDQSPVNTPADETADAADFETGAVLLGDLPGWYHAARISYANGTRPGQRQPAIYCSYSARTQVVNALIAAGITSGPRLWLADWDTAPEIYADILSTSGGPFPVIGMQLHNAGTHDVNLMLTSWLDTVSKAPAAPNPLPLNQRGVVVSYTTETRRDVTSADHGDTWR